MPGVPPDALAQVKRGLRGLFGRKKKHLDQPKPTSDAPTNSTTAAAPVAAANVPEPTKTETGFPPAPQPSSTTSAPNTNPSASHHGPAAPQPSEQQISTPAPKGVHDVHQKPEDLPSAAQTLTPDTGPPPAPKAGEPGMSATSGPLDDQIAHEYSDLGNDQPAPVTKQGEDLGAAAKEQVSKVEGRIL